MTSAKRQRTMMMLMTSVLTTSSLLFSSTSVDAADLTAYTGYLKPERELSSDCCNEAFGPGECFHIVQLIAIMSHLTYLVCGLPSS